MRALLSCFSSLSGKLIWKMSPLVLGEILGMFVNTLTADGRYPVQGLQNLTVPFQIQLSEKRKTFDQFFVPFLESTSKFKHFEKKMMLIANVFPKLGTVKIFVRKRSQEHHFGTGFYSQHMKASQVLAKSLWERFYHVFLTFWGKLIWNLSPLVLGEILAIFVNTLTADGKYPVQGSENFQLPSQIKISKKQKIFCELFVAFLESTLKFRHFEQKDDCHS